MLHRGRFLVYVGSVKLRVKLTRTARKVDDTCLCTLSTKLSMQQTNSNMQIGDSGCLLSPILMG